MTDKRFSNSLIRLVKIKRDIDSRPQTGGYDFGYRAGILKALAIMDEEDARLEGE